MTRPDWVRHVETTLPEISAQSLSRFLPPEDFSGRESAVLILLTEIDSQIEVVLIERSSDGRAHSGQIAFPGGGVDPGETHIDAALREAAEEIGLLIDSAQVLGTMPRLWVPVSDNAVTPVVAWWHSPHEVSAVDVGEVAAVARVQLDQLVAQENRAIAIHPSGFRGPAFLVNDWVVWGFTGGLLSGLLNHLGWLPEFESVREVHIR